MILSVSFVFLILSQVEFGCINSSKVMRKRVEDVVSARADGIILPHLVLYLIT